MPLIPRDPREAFSRHARHYLRVAGEADRIYGQGSAHVATAAAFFDSEWDQIRSGHQWAIRNADDDQEAALMCIRYENAALHCLDLRRDLFTRRLWHEAALRVAERLHDGESIARIATNLAGTLRECGLVHEAASLNERALTIVRTLGLRKQEGIVLGNLGVDYVNLGDNNRALKMFDERLSIARECNDVQGAAAVLGNMGTLYAYLGDATKAIQFFEEALNLHHKCGNRPSEAQCLGNLGRARSLMRDEVAALDLYKKALTINREIRNRSGECAILNAICNSYVMLGDTRTAEDVADSAITIALEVGDPSLECVARAGFAAAVHHAYGVQSALPLYERALAIARTLDIPLLKGHLLLSIGLCLNQLGNRSEAATKAGEALLLLERTSLVNADKARQRLDHWQPRGSSDISALTNINTVGSDMPQSETSEQFVSPSRHTPGPPSHANELIEAAHLAFKLSRTLGDRRPQRDALIVLGNAYRDSQSVAAIDYYREALLMSQELEDGRAEGLLLGAVGQQYLDRDDPRSAFESFSNMLRVAHRIPDAHMELVSIDSIAKASLLMGEPDTALRNYELLIARARECENKDIEVGALWSLALLFHVRGDHTRAREYSDTTLAILSELADVETSTLVRKTIATWLSKPLEIP